MRRTFHPRRFDHCRQTFLSILLTLVMIISGIAGTKTISMQFKVGDISYSKIRDYDVVSLVECDLLHDSLRVGEPMLPMKILRVLLPAGTEVTNVRSTVVGEVLLDGKYKVYPIQPPLYTGDQGVREFTGPKKTIYGSTESFPAVQVEFQVASYFREHHIAEFTVYPIQYRPLLGEVTCFTHMTIDNVPELP